MTLFIGNLYVYSMIYANTTEEAFEEGDPPTSTTSAEAAKNSTPLGELIIRGAGYFLKAGSDISILSERFEMTALEGVDSYGLYNAANSAVYNLEMMAYYYGELVSKADNTPYNQTVINKLTSFNYPSFRNQKGLIKDVFDQVEGYLKDGDVRGAYKKIQFDINNLLDRLYNIRWLIYWGYLPTSQKIMDLNQDYMNCHLFGQYMARVFEAIKEN